MMFSWQGTIIEILLIIAGICIGYGLHSNIRDIVRSIRDHLWSFWTYKILKKPKPDPVELMMDLMPVVMVASAIASISNSLSKAVEKEKKEYIAKKKAR